MSDDDNIPLRFATIWPWLVLSLGIVATIVWVAFLGWLLLAVAQAIL